MIARLLTIPAAVALTLGLAAGTASANNPVASANCDGLAFNMSDGVGGTRITATLDGQQVRTVTVANQHDSTAFTIASPDRTVGHVWTVLVDAPWDIADQSFRFTVDACVSPSTTTIPPTSVPPSTTVPPVVAVDIPPTVPPTVPGRPVNRPSTTTTPADEPAVPTGSLPATGADDLWLALAALACVIGGAGLVCIPRRGVK